MPNEIRKEDLDWYTPGICLSTIQLKSELESNPNIGYRLSVIGTNESLSTRIGAGDRPETPYHDEFLQIEEFESTLLLMRKKDRYLHAMITSYDTDRKVDVVFIYPGHKPQTFEVDLTKGQISDIIFKVKIDKNSDVYAKIRGDN